MKQPIANILTVLLCAIMFANPAHSTDSNDQNLQRWNTSAKAKPCAKVPQCSSGQILNYLTNSWHCISLPNCASTQALTRQGGAFKCVTLQR
ncbi:MAG: hypothetical protein ACYYK0_03740 [Candidatus Eutrophobiaceae bacterium]